VTCRNCKNIMSGRQRVTYDAYTCGCAQPHYFLVGTGPGGMTCPHCNAALQPAAARTQLHGELPQCASCGPAPVVNYFRPHPP
jgi:DNA-directed RNA polymerase subunit M/transcription elongation factor TFIIS